LRQPERAVRLATQAKEANPQDARARFVLGLAHYRAGASKEAAKVLERLPGANSAASFVLAMSYWRLGNKAKARECYTQGNAWMEQHHPLDVELERLFAEAKTTLGVRATCCILRSLRDRKLIMPSTGGVATLNPRLISETPPGSADAFACIAGW
jgi:tetratricopeptide (TPR) repeat protein